MLGSSRRQRRCTFAVERNFVQSLENKDGRKNGEVKVTVDERLKQPIKPATKAQLDEIERLCRAKRAEIPKIASMREAGRWLREEKSWGRTWMPKKQEHAAK